MNEVNTSRKIKIPFYFNLLQTWFLIISISYRISKVAQHKTDTDAWTVIHGKIYDVTHYLHYHPGGKDKLMMGAGRDGTELF